MIAAARENIYVGIAPMGKGIFTSKDIKKGSVICTFNGRKMTFIEAKALGRNESYALQIGHDLYIYLDAPEKFINHSCEPNCGLRGLELIALADIKAGEQLFYDYSTTMLERSWTMVCHCGTKNCRKIITDFDLTPQATQAKYIHLGVVQPFIVDAIATKSAAR